MTAGRSDTVVDERPTSSLDNPRPQRPRSRLGAVASNRALQAIVIAAGALVLRLIGLQRSFDIFVDEITYTRIAVSLADGKGVALAGVPFDLHPPAMMAVLALVIKVFGLHGSLEQTLFDLRPVSSVFGALSCAGAYLLAERASNRRWGVLVALLVALDPLVVLYDSRVMLEAMSQAALVAMCVLLAGATWSRRAGAARACALGAGLCGAIVVCTKETFGLVAVLLLLVLLISKWVLLRRYVFMTLFLTFAGYATYVVCIGLSTGFSTWWNDQANGALRLIGTVQTTGFNAPTTHVSLLSRAFANGATDGVTYALLFFGALASLGIVWRLKPWRRAWKTDAGLRQRVGLLIALWAICASAYLSYAILIGSLEEQMFYIMVLPTTASLCIWVAQGAGSWRPNWRRLTAVVLLGALLAEGAVWGVVHTRVDNTYQQFLAWEPTHVAPDSTISVTEGTAQFFIQNAVIGDWSTLAELRAHKVDYVLLSTTLVTQGYGSARTSFEQLLDRKATVVFQASGASAGSLRLYNVKKLVEAAP